MNNNKQIISSSQNRNSKKKKFQSGRFASGEQMVIYRPKFICPFSPRYRTKLRVAIQGNIVAASLPGVYTVSGNSLYLPFSGGVWPGVVIASIATLQPAGYSNLCANLGPYRNYRVYRSTLTVRCVPSLATDIVTIAVGVPTGVVFTSVSDALAERGTQSTIVQSGAQVKTLSKTQTTANVFGITPSTVENEVVGLYSAVYNAQPTQSWLFNFAWTTSNGGTLGGNMSYEAEVVFDAEFWGLQTGSLLDN